MLAGLDPYQHLYAHRTGSFRSSAMRDLMAITSRPEVISLAGGLPDTRAFPPDLLQELVADVTANDGPRALQYGPTEGLDELRHAVTDLMAEDGTLVGAAELIITTGGQQALDLLCRVLVDPGDAVLAEGPTCTTLPSTPRASGSTSWRTPWSGWRATAVPRSSCT